MLAKTKRRRKITYRGSKHKRKTYTSYLISNVSILSIVLCVLGTILLLYSSSSSSNATIEKKSNTVRGQKSNYNDLHDWKRGINTGEINNDDDEVDNLSEVKDYRDGDDGDDGNDGNDGEEGNDGDDGDNGDDENGSDLRSNDKKRTQKMIKFDNNVENKAQEVIIHDKHGKDYKSEGNSQEFEEAQSHFLQSKSKEKYDKESIKDKDMLINELKTKLRNTELEFIELMKREEEAEAKKHGIKVKTNFLNDDSQMEPLIHDMFDPSESISLPFAIDKSAKSHFAFSVWLYFSPNTSLKRHTILTTKNSGCSALKPNANNGGISLYFNRKFQLALDFMTTEGCNTIQTDRTPIPNKSWMHVGVSVINTDGATLKLFINGAVVADSKTYFTSDKSGENNAKEPITLIQSIQEQTRLGELFEHDEYLKGSLSNLVIWKDQIIDENKMKQIYDCGMDKEKIIKDKSIVEADKTLTFLYPLDNSNIEEEKIQSLSAKKISNISPKPTLIKAVTNNTLIHPDWKPLGPNRYSEYKDGSNIFKVTPDIKIESDEKARSRRGAVRNAMIHAWNGYKTYAWGQDEIFPISRRGRNNWGGLGTTLVDALDTLWLMDLKDEFWEARDWVRDHLKHDTSTKISVFETTIRNLGGLLAAYDLSGDEAFYEKALDLGEKLSLAFSSPTGIAFTQVGFSAATVANKLGSYAVISQAGALQVEFRYLAKITGQEKYATDSERFFTLMKFLQPKDTGLFPYLVNNMANGEAFGNADITFGANGKSFYEYVLKIWLQGGKKESMYREMYDKAMDGLHDNLLFKTISGFTYIAEMTEESVQHKMDHLVCFMAGSLALGAYTHPDGLESPKAQRDLKTGKALAYTCYQMYASTKTGLGPETVNVEYGFMQPDAKSYLLRPEAIESFFILYHLTGDPVYREWGWEAFQAIERYCRTESGYSAIKDVDSPKSHLDSMESFFLAATLKYSYLLQDPDTEIDLLNKHVFNTEAHPLSILKTIKLPNLIKKEKKKRKVKHIQQTRVPQIL